MEYLTELINLENEWNGIKISGEEHAKAVNESSESKERKRNEIVAYRSKLLSSNLIIEGKERRLKEIAENLNYLDQKNSPKDLQKPDDNQLLTGILLGGLIAVLGMYFMDQVKNYLKDSLSEGVLNGIYSELQKQRI